MFYFEYGLFSNLSSEPCIFLCSCIEMTVKRESGNARKQQKKVSRNVVDDWKVRIGLKELFCLFFCKWNVFVFFCLLRAKVLVWGIHKEIYTKSFHHFHACFSLAWMSSKTSTRRHKCLTRKTKSVRENPLMFYTKVGINCCSIKCKMKV